MRSAISHVHEDVKQSVAGRTESSGSDPSVQLTSLQLLGEGSLPARVRRTDSAWLS